MGWDCCMRTAITQLPDASPQHWQSVRIGLNSMDAAITLLADAPPQQWQILHKRLNGVEAAL
eukprot:12935036-Prorocentrum_lima.AAC.1